MQRRNLTMLLLGIALLLLGVWMPAPSLHAQSTVQGLTLSATPAFDGHFKYGEWLPIWVQVENIGRDLEAQVQARITSRNGVITYAAPASLPGGSRKRIPLYVPPNSFSHELDVQLVEVAARDRRNVLLARTVEIEPLPNITYLIGIVAPQRGALSLLNGVTLPGQRRPIALVDLPLADLPDRVEGLRSFDLLILNDLDTSTLSPAQIRVLESWVHAGGRLVIGGGAGALTTTAGMPASLLPLTLRAVIDVDDISALANFAAADPIRVPGPFVVARGDEIRGQILAGDADLPLIVEHTLGNGFVDFIALDPTVAPFEGWSSVAPFWEKLISPGAAYPDWMPADMSPARGQTEQMGYALSMLPSLDLPSVRSLAILLAVYILVIGPVNYLLLRRWRRLHWAWITIPVLTILFSAGAFGIGYTLRGSDLILNKIALITLNGDGPAEVLSFVGIFSPAQQAYDVEVDGDGLLSPTVRNADPWNMGGVGGAAEMVIVQGAPGRLQGLAISQWSMQSFTTESQWSDFGRVEGTFQFADDELRGEIRNDTPYPLTDVVVLWGNYFKRIGDLAAGETIPVVVDLENDASVMMGYSLGWRIYQQEFEGAMGRFPRELEIKRNILDTLSQGMGRLQPMNAKIPAPLNLREVTVLGWLSEAPPTVRIAGETPSQQTTALLNVNFAPQWPANGEIYLPPGIVAGQIVQLPQEGGPCGMGGSTSIYIGRGEALFDFTLPPEFGDLTVNRLNLSLLSDGGWMAAPHVALYDWDGERWLEVESPQMGINSLVFEPGMIDEDGRFRVRLSADANQGGGCYYLDLGVEGQRRGAQS